MFGLIISLALDYQRKMLLFAFVIRHSRLPAGNALWFCQKFFLFFFFFFFFRRQGFRMITFDRQAGPLPNFNRSHVMVIGRSVSFSDPARPTPPKHPKIPPPPTEKLIKNCMRFRTPGTFLKKKNSSDFKILVQLTHGDNGPRSQMEGLQNGLVSVFLFTILTFI